MREALVRVRDYIHEYHSSLIALDTLAALARMSRFHLVRAFSREFGLPPHAFQIGVRISKARKLLAEGQRPAAVAAALGFADPSHFGRLFARATGTTPQQYARSGGRPASKAPAGS